MNNSLPGSSFQALHLSIAGENSVSTYTYMCMYSFVSEVMFSIVLTHMHSIAEAGGLRTDECTQGSH